jgi:hypothetical protein
MSVVAEELREQLLIRERELDSRESTIAALEDGLATSEHTLGRECMERDTACTQAEAARQDYRARLCASTSSSKHSINFYRMLQERQRLVSLQETDLEVREMKLAEEGSGPTSLRWAGSTSRAG